MALLLSPTQKLALAPSWCFWRSDVICDCIWWVSDGRTDKRVQHDDRFEVLTGSILSPWWWKQKAPVKRRSASTTLHSSVSRHAATFIPGGREDLKSRLAISCFNKRFFSPFKIWWTFPFMFIAYVYCYVEYSSQIWDCHGGEVIGCGIMNCDTAGSWRCLQTYRLIMPLLSSRLNSEYGNEFYTALQTKRL
jgi:hypothetical protein